MTEEEIRSHIFSTLTRLYEDPLHRKQFKRFTFEGDDQKVADNVLSKLIRNYVIEQMQPEVVRLTDLGYQLIQPDLKNTGRKSSGYDTATAQDLTPPSPDEIASLSWKLGAPDYVTASHFTEGQFVIFWATKGFKKITGYSLKELKKAGGAIVLIRDEENRKKIERLVQDLVNSDEVGNNIDIFTKNGYKRTLCILTKARRDSNGRLSGTITAARDVTSVK